MKSSEILEKNITRKRFDELTCGIIGMPVSKTWKGHGTAIFLEFGNLKKVDSEKYEGYEASLMLEFDWRVENARSIDFGSLHSERKIQNGIKEFIGKLVTEIKIEGRLPEIILLLDKNKWIRSFTLYEGQPLWTLFLPDGSWLCVSNGKLIREKSLS